MIGGVIKKTRLVQVRSHGEAVNLPRADAGLYFESVKAQPDIRALPHIDQATRAIFHLVSADSELDPVAFIPRSDFEECCLEIDLFFVDRPGPTDAVRIQTALELDEGTNVLSVMNVDIKNVAFF